MTDRGGAYLYGPGKGGSEIIIIQFNVQPACPRGANDGSNNIVRVRLPFLWRRGVSKKFKKHSRTLSSPVYFSLLLADTPWPPLAGFRRRLLFAALFFLVLNTRLLLLLRPLFLLLLLLLLLLYTPLLSFAS